MSRTMKGSSSQTPEAKVLLARVTCATGVVGKATGAYARYLQLAVQ